MSFTQVPMVPACVTTAQYPQQESSEVSGASGLNHKIAIITIHAPYLYFTAFTFTQLFVRVCGTMQSHVWICVTTSRANIHNSPITRIPHVISLIATSLPTLTSYPHP